MNSSGFAVLDQVAMVIMPVGHSELIVGQVDHETGAGNQQPDLIGENMIAGQLRLQCVETNG